MTTDISVRQPAAALAIRPGQDFWTDKQQAALAVLGIKNATNADLAVFMHYCQKTGLDPFSRQIYMICRREKQGDTWVDKQTIQVGIDGFRVIRDRVARQLGITVEYEDTTWFDADGREHGVWLWDEPPAACRVVVVKDGRRFPAVVRTASYIAMKDGKPVSQWRTQPDHMIEKCAEAFALRRAFPHDLGGLYIDEEMPAAEPAQTRPQRVTAAEITGQQATASPGPAETHGSGDGPAPGAPVTTSVSSAGPAQPKIQQPSPAAVKKLQDLTAQLLGTWPDDEVQELYVRITGAEWTGSRSQVTAVAGLLDDALQAAKGDAEAAAASLWAQFHPEPGA